jgi:transposase-like protein
MANWNQLTESKFKAIKTLLKGGATQKEAAEHMKVSPNTAFWVNKAETFEEYVQINASRHLEKRQVAAIKAKEANKETPAPQVVEYRQNVTIQATHYMMQKLDETNSLLKQISNKLACIVEDLYGKKDDE